MAKGPNPKEHQVAPGKKVKTVSESESSPVDRGEVIAVQPPLLHEAEPRVSRLELSRPQFSMRTLKKFLELLSDALRELYSCDDVDPLLSREILNNALEQSDQVIILLKKHLHSYILSHSEQLQQRSWRTVEKLFHKHQMHTLFHQYLMIVWLVKEAGQSMVVRDRRIGGSKATLANLRGLVSSQNSQRSMMTWRSFFKNGYGQAMENLFQDVLNRGQFESPTLTPEQLRFVLWSVFEGWARSNTFSNQQTQAEMLLEIGGPEQLRERWLRPFKGSFGTKQLRAVLEALVQPEQVMRSYLRLQRYKGVVVGAPVSLILKTNHQDIGVNVYIDLAGRIPGESGSRYPVIDLSFRDVDSDDVVTGAVQLEMMLKSMAGMIYLQKQQPFEFVNSDQFAGLVAPTAFHQLNWKQKFLSRSLEFSNQHAEWLQQMMGLIAVIANDDRVYSLVNALRSLRGTYDGVLPSFDLSLRE